mmetsp:Transcript_16455/g.29288  ORF Transcript_16455/g.29288 Transcript_16455/m.29288 type:complete len:270 (-) Transcript_16455:506-1315(-)
MARKTARLMMQLTAVRRRPRRQKRLRRPRTRPLLRSHQQRAATRLKRSRHLVLPPTPGQKALEVMAMLLVTLAPRRHLRQEAVVLQSAIGNRSAPAESRHAVSAHHHGASHRHHGGPRQIVDRRHPAGEALEGAFLWVSAAVEVIVAGALVADTEELLTEIGAAIAAVALHSRPDVSGVEATVNADAATEAAATADFGKSAGVWSHGAEGEESIPWSHHRAAVSAAKMAAAAVVGLEVGADGEAAAAMLVMKFGMTADRAEPGVTTETL